MTKYDWTEIPIEIATKIRDHIELYDDYEAFSEICSTWRLAIKKFPCQYINRKHTQLPWLMLVDPNDSSYRRFYSLTKRKFLKIDLPPSLISPPQVRRYFSSRGWLISVTKNITKSTDAVTFCNISLFDPFSNKTIEAPLFHLTDLTDIDEWEDELLVSFFGKFAVSTSPTAKGSDSDDFVVAMIFGQYRKLAFWRLGHDDSWVVPSNPGLNTGWFYELCFFRGEIYVVDNDSRVIAFGDLKDRENGRPPRVVADLRGLTDNRYAMDNSGGMGGLPVNSNSKGSDKNYYLVESKYDQSEESHASSLLFIHRFVDIESFDDPKYETVSFKVFKVNVDNRNVEKVKSLGNQAIFVGFNSTFVVQVCANVDDDRKCKPDCIYYTDDIFELYGAEDKPGGGRDMGIYSLAQGNKRPFYEGPSRFSIINPPIWFEFSSA